MKILNTVYYTMKSELFNADKEVVVQIASKGFLTNAEALIFLKKISSLIISAKVVSIDVLDTDVWNIIKERRAL